jgi:hypothetical protein
MPWGTQDRRRTWHELADVLWMMRPEERAILSLMREGKEASDVATVMGLGSRQHAEKEMKRVVGIARFYVQHAPVLAKLYGGQMPIPRRQEIILRLYVVHRMSQPEIARVLGYTSRWVPYMSLRDAKERLARAGGHDDVLAMLADCERRQWLRRSRRRIAMDEYWRDAIVEFLLDNLGSVYYVWGGQDVLNGNADCSGLVLEVLKMAGRLPEDAPDMTAQGISRLYPVTRNPKPGDLAFFGRSWSKVTHVAFFVGEIEGVGEECIAGMCGGCRGMTREVAKKVGAALWIRRLRYRRDYLGCRRVS